MRSSSIHSLRVDVPIKNPSPESRIHSPTCAPCHRCLSNTHRPWLTYLDADFTGRASADEFNKAALLRPNVSSWHACDVGAGLNPASAHWDPLLSVAFCVEVHLYGSTHWKWIHLSSEVRSLEWLLPHILCRYSTSTGTHRSLLECDPNELLLPTFWVLRLLHQDYMKALDGLRWTQFTFLWPAWSDLGSEPVHFRFWSGLRLTL